ncbi:hypothetical protein RND81_14G231300 [Saponaria officinalis]|uniref:Uncharacterized protein n=1 Tax=Saponaria officinalis TaxID=3572 RepID=A0AAW1GSW6_SAPOF
MAPAITYRISCKKQGSDGAYYVAVRNDTLALAAANTDDDSQLIMVNKPCCDNGDKSVLWAEETEDESGYKFLKAPPLVDMVMDALGASINDDATISVYPRKRPTSDNQLWTFVPV